MAAQRYEQLGDEDPEEDENVELEDARLMTECQYGSVPVHKNEQPSNKHMV